jgi:uncharacterized NAD(P)/FAD-binding protein YdhS
MKKITIIGGGASGTLLAANLLGRANGMPVEINLVEVRDKVGRGVAFGTNLNSHLLNVPAGKMGAFPDDVEHFHSWLTEQGHDYEASDFVPRLHFGKYLQSVLTDAVARSAESARLNLIDDEAVDMSVDADTADVILRSGEVIRSHHVVLAFGNHVPPHPSVADQSFVTADKYFVDPWSSAMYEKVRPDDHMFIVGTGLSMVDVALHSHKAGRTGKIYAISTRGLLPAVHKLGFTYPSFLDELRPMKRVTDMLKAVRRHIQRAHESGSDWRGVIDSMRPGTQDLWLSLSRAEKQYFRQHLSRYWNVARHRMPPEAAAILDEMRAAGQLEILKGRLTSISHDGSGFEIKYTNGSVETTVTADALVNCIGSESNFERIDSIFVKNLIARGHIRNDELSLGIEASPDGKVVNKHGVPSTIVRTLGTSLKGILWESTAIPEIRTQARDLASSMLDGNE